MKSSSGFDNIVEALIQQKQVLEDLQAENESLRHQLADLRAGHGILLKFLALVFRSPPQRMPRSLTEAQMAMHRLSMPSRKPRPFLL